MAKVVTLEDIEITGVNMWPPHDGQPLRVGVNYEVKTDDPGTVLSRSSDFTSDLPVGFVNQTGIQMFATLKAIALAKEGMS